MSDDPRYPIGHFERPASLSEGERKLAIEQIAQAPRQLRAAVEGWSDQQLDTAYRPDGWTVRQVLHHIPDSHINSYVRFRLALTEDEPTITTYKEDAWAQLEDAQKAPVGVSLDLLDALHQRWARLLRSLTPEQWERTFRHPAMGLMRLDVNAALYAWHGRHHLAQITSLRDRMGW
jgi:uncharacterized damage-inducible protein DinB